MSNPTRLPAQAGFGTESLKHSMKPCHNCAKVVYPMEFLGASDKAFHKNCFRCLTCNKPLQQNNYSTLDDKFYCTPHYEQMYKASMM